MVKNALVIIDDVAWPRFALFSLIEKRRAFDAVRILAYTTVAEELLGSDIWAKTETIDAC